MILAQDLSSNLPFSEVCSNWHTGQKIKFLDISSLLDLKKQTLDIFAFEVSQILAELD